MKKTVRILLRVGGAGIALLLVGLCCCVDGLDYRPYFTTPYYSQTKERWKSQIANYHAIQGELEAGFGHALLTPTLNAPETDGAKGRFRSLPLAGFGSRKGRPARETHDNLYVKAIAFRVSNRIGVMAAADALIVPREVAETALARLKQELKLEREQVYFGATHSHASLGGWGQGIVAEQFAGPYEPAVRTWFADRLVAAVRAAVADLSPASIGHGCVAIPEFARNRLVGDLGRINPNLNFLVIKKASGGTAILGSYSAHATVLPSSLMEFSADYPGSWQRAVEKATGGMAVFFAGGVGSHSPVAGAREFDGAERMGQGLARAILTQLPSVQLNRKVTFGVLGLEVALPELHARLTDGIRLRPWVARCLLPVTDRTFLQVFRLNDACWVSTPCDFSGELALDLKEYDRARGFETTVTSFNGDYIGYVIPHRYYHLNGYEPRVMSFFGPNVPDYFTELIHTMLTDLEK